MQFTEKTEQQLKEYVALLLKWNKSINLISKNTEKDIWNRHIVDSAQLYKYIDPEQNIWDLGSGAGFPGLVLSILGARNLTLVESDNRKCIFLRQASNISENKVVILNERIEKLDSAYFTIPDILVSRALCSITDFLDYSKIFTSTKSFFLLKGKNYQKELDDASENWHFDSCSYTSKTNIDSVILEIKNVTAKY